MIIIYHSKDLDGFCSAAVCKRKYPDATLIGYDYGQPFPWDKIDNAEPVIIVDVSLPMEDMHRLLDHTGDLTWMDHHISAIEDCGNYPNWPDYAATRFTKVLQVGIAACEIAWNYLFPDEPMPLAVKLLGMYDTWRQNDPEHNQDTEVLPFQYGMRLKCDSAESFPSFLFENRIYTDPVKREGFAVLKYQKQQDKLSMYGSFECDFLGYKAIMCNIRGAGSLAFESVLQPHHQLMVGFGYTGRQWSFSLRTDKEDVDVSAIAKQFGGGGHRKAAGFAVDDLNSVIDLTQFKKPKYQP